MEQLLAGTEEDELCPTLTTNGHTFTAIFANERNSI
jgi:hypothetical protein